MSTEQTKRFIDRVNYYWVKVKKWDVTEPQTCLAWVCFNNLLFCNNEWSDFKNIIGCVCRVNKVWKVYFHDYEAGILKEIVGSDGKIFKLIKDAMKYFELNNWVKYVD